MPSSPRPPVCCDLFCAVIDNYGDAAVCWRLARQLAAEHGWQVRLLIDDPEPLGTLSGRPMAGRQVLGPGIVEVRPWDAGVRYEQAAVVVEAFACALPAAYEEAMARAARTPLWINLDYLSAEDWVESCHLQTSPHPRLPLRKTFFFPGFTARTGGLLREAGLFAAREAHRRAPWWRTRGLPEVPEGACVVSLFAYENPALDCLLDVWREASQPVVALVPTSRISPGVARYFGSSRWQPGQSLQAGALSVHALPFTDQEGYDRLLWSCDFNFVRGEDSLVRAQWAARPFCWHIYAQEDAAHLVKLDALLDRYHTGLPDEDAAALRTLWHAWNGSPHAASGPAQLARAWAQLRARPDAWCEHATAWAARLGMQRDLCTNLVEFVEERL